MFWSQATVEFGIRDVVISRVARLFLCSGNFAPPRTTLTGGDKERPENYVQLKFLYYFSSLPFELSSDSLAPPKEFVESNTLFFHVYRYENTEIKQRFCFFQQASSEASGSGQQARRQDLPPGGAKITRGGGH